MYPYHGALVLKDKVLRKIVHLRFRQCDDCYVIEGRIVLEQMFHETRLIVSNGNKSHPSDVMHPSGFKMLTSIDR